MESRATGTTVVGIRQSELRKVLILLPTKKIQDEASRILDPLIQEMQFNSDENETLASIRDTLLPKLLSGEIRVADAETIAERLV
jgi:type I restriction enzyme S subunit